MKKIITILLILMILFIFACENKVNVSTDNNSPNQNTNSKSTDKGRAVFTITDAATEMGTVSKVEMKVDSIKIHSESKGWTTVSTNSKIYDLLKLKANSKNALLANAELEEGTYNKMELEISEVIVVDSQGSHKATLPSNKMILNGQLVVEEGFTSTANFDVLLDESLHTTKEDEYVLAPVIDLETRSQAQVNVKNEEDIEISGGEIITDVKIGMDINGNVGVGLKIPANAVISVSGGVINNVGVSLENDLGIAA
ncbi:DUF4382 domain-containing protein [Candidatus Woesearchaeota archaeon]|nr:DUF4382 domain-containing protein [Candidatus Woesearchaeota archaeon]